MPRKKRKKETPEEALARVQKNIEKSIRVGTQLHFKKGYWYRKWKKSMVEFAKRLEE